MLMTVFSSSSNFSSSRHQPVCRGQRRLQPPVPVQAAGCAVRLPHRPGAHRRHEDLHRPRGLPALLPPHRHPPHLAGDQQQQRGHPTHRRQGGLGPRLRRHRQPHLLDRHHTQGGSVKAKLQPNQSLKPHGSWFFIEMSLKTKIVIIISPCL